MNIKKIPENRGIWACNRSRK